MAITWDKETNVFAGTDGEDSRLVDRVKDYVYNKRPDGTGDVPPATQAQIDTKIESIETDFAATVYSWDRRMEYPSVGDQLDMMMKDMRDGTTTHQTACEDVKTKYPKPE